MLLHNEKPTKKRLDKLIDVALRVRPFIPFIALNTVRRLIDGQGQTILDIGCGDGSIVRALVKNKKAFTLGADIYLPSLKECQQQSTHDGFILSNALDLPFTDSSFDIVLAIEVVEHMDKERGRRAIKAWEKIAKRQMIVTTPVGICRVQAKGDSSYDEHKSTWYPADFREMGYTVRGHGLRLMYGDTGWFNSAPKIMNPLLYFISVIVGPVVYFRPELAGKMVSVKKIKLSKNAQQNSHV